MAIAWPLTTWAQQPAKPVIGFLNSGLPGGGYPPVSAFLKGLGETGLVEGRDVLLSDSSELKEALAHHRGE